MTFSPGALVRARNREWVVLPESDAELLVLRPLGGTDREIAGVLTALEPVTPAAFELPSPEEAGDFAGSRLLRDAVKLGFRSGAGPFRSFGRLAFAPRPYQLVPLLLAMKLEPIRLLVADDVGVGKTIEAGLIARELLDRGEIQRIGVLCPPHLAEQWEAELREKFHIPAVRVLPGTAAGLERNCRMGESLFERYPFVVVSKDFIKSDRHREEFLRACPEFVIVDEAHTCAEPGAGGAVRHQSHRLVADMVKDPERHILFLTATPHSGKEHAFRSLLQFLKPEFGELPEDLSGRANQRRRREIAAHFVQRKRADIRRFLSADTPFPEREEREVSYRLSGESRKFFEKVIRYARETIEEGRGMGRHRQRIRWWSVLALLRSLASSPAAAAATLRTRAGVAETETAEETDALGRRTVMDLADDESADLSDVTPGADATDPGESDAPRRRRLLAFAREAEKLRGKLDRKLMELIPHLESLLADGFRPILFCRFIQTAEYLAEELRKRLKGTVEVAAVTGSLPPAEREARVLSLAEASRRVLVCTDCLSEGVNLQAHFDAVIHYDLSWNPTRHEQREGRVDRYGQAAPAVRVMTYYGVDNQIDGLVLEVLIRKHKKIRSSLGISVPVPVGSDTVLEAILEGLLLKEKPRNDSQLALPGFDDFAKPLARAFYEEWENVSRLEKRSRTVFAQETVKPGAVAEVLDATRAAIGSGVDVRRFVETAFRRLGAVASPAGADSAAVAIDPAGAPRGLRDRLGWDGPKTVRFEPPAGEGEIPLHRTHPAVESLAGYVMDTALDPLREGIARRCGVIRTGAVSTRTTLLLVRFRFHIVTVREGTERPLPAEDCRTLAFEGAPAEARWLDSETAESLLTAAPDANVPPEQARNFLARIIDDFSRLSPRLSAEAEARGRELLESHRSVRSAARIKGLQYRVEPQLPPDVLGIYVFLPVPGKSAGR